MLLFNSRKSILTYRIKELKLEQQSLVNYITETTWYVPNDKLFMYGILERAINRLEKLIN